MLTAFDTSVWQNFFIAQVGAAAALVGLLFVAISINLTKILALTSLPGRAFEAFVVLVMVLFIASVGLVPGQAPQLVGAEVLFLAVASWVTTVVIQRRSSKPANAPRSWMLSRVVFTQLATLPMVVAGVSLVIEKGGGLYWTVPGVIGALMAALVDAWVLLVEIQR